MQQWSLITQNADYRPVFNLGSAVLGLVACGMVVITLMHTLHVLGQDTPLYKQYHPAEGWNKRFYPASAFMIISLLVAMWLLNVWSHKVLPQ